MSAHRQQNRNENGKSKNAMKNVYESVIWSRTRKRL